MLGHCCSTRPPLNVRHVRNYLSLAIVRLGDMARIWRMPPIHQHNRVFVWLAFQTNYCSPHIHCSVWNFCNKGLQPGDYHLCDWWRPVYCSTLYHIDLCFEFEVVCMHQGNMWDIHTKEGVAVSKFQYSVRLCFANLWIFSIRIYII